jgi:hypothetical protein
MDVIIDDLWTKICRDVMKDGKGKPTEQEMLIGFQPGNSMDSMVQNLFGDDPLVYTAIKNGLIYKAKTGGASIDRGGANQAGMTTNAVQERQEAMALGTRGLGQSASAGSYAYRGAQGGLNALSGLALEGDDALGALGPLKALNSLAALMQTLGGAGGGIGNSVMSFFMAALGLKGRATGGPVGGKVPYVVGEEGPELFIPKVDGTIIPNMDGKNPFRHHGGSVKTTGPDMGKTEWARALISKLGGTANETNTSAVLSWMAEEGGHWKNSAGYNPLNTTRNMPGAKLMDGGPGRAHGVKHFTSWEQGLEATVLTLTEKAKERGYDKIVNSIITGKDKNRIMEAVYASKWGTGKGGGTSGSTDSADGTASPSLSTDENDAIKSSFISVYGDKKGASLFKMFQEFNKTGKLPEGNTVGSMLGLGGSDASAMAAAMGGGGGSTVNYGGVTFNITTPADNKSFIDSVKQALKDLNFLKIGKD